LNTNDKITDGKTLLNILKPKNGTPPPFKGIPYDEMILEHLKSTPDITASPSPQNVLILCGPPGCGKSTIKSNLLREFNIENYINIDPDEIRTLLTSQGVTFPDDTTMSGITNSFNKRIYDFSLDQKYNLVFDTTGQNFRAISDLLYQSRVKGYKIYFVVIWASLETCKRRVNMRNQKLLAEGSGRIQLDDKVVEEIYSGFVKPKGGTASNYLINPDKPYYPRITANQILLYNNDNDNQPPQLLYKKVGNQVQNPVTPKPGFYDMNIVSQPPYIVRINAGTGGKRRKTKKYYKKNKRTKRSKSKKRTIRKSV
jgi:predicted ABC-type ATPase